MGRKVVTEGGSLEEGRKVLSRARTPVAGKSRVTRGRSLCAN